MNEVALLEHFTFSVNIRC